VIKVYGYAASINVRKVLWMCDELGLAVLRDDWDGRLPAFRALSPVGMVPVIDDDGVIVWESNVIVRYLAASRASDLLPVAPGERAHVEQWMDWQGSDFNNSWRVPMQVLVRGNPAQAAALPAAIETFNAAVGVIDAQLANSAYVAGTSFTVADIVIALSLVRWRSIPMARPAAPNVDRYLDRLGERAGFARYGNEAW
jgi:glutathione S-transferase